MKKLLFLLVFIPLVAFGQTAEEHFNYGVKKATKTLAKSQDFYDAIYQFTKAIELNPNYEDAYFWRGKIRGYEIINKDVEGAYYSEAIKDFNKVIELNPDNAEAYFWRGRAKFNFEDYKGAIADYTKVIKLKPISFNFPSSYYERGWVKKIIGDLNGACEDWNQAKKLGFVPLPEIEDYCN